MNEQDIQDILVALLTEDSVQLGERAADAEPTFEAISTFGRTYPESTAPPLPVGEGLERARKTVFVGAFSHARDSAYYFSRIGGGEYSTPDGDRQGVP